MKINLLITIFAVIGFTILIIIGVSSSDPKIEGEWLNYDSNTQMLTIQKNDSAFISTPNGLKTVYIITYITTHHSNIIKTEPGKYGSTKVWVNKELSTFQNFIINKEGKNIEL